MKRLITYLIVIVVIAIAVIAGAKAVKKKTEAEAKTPVAVTYAIHVRSVSPKLEHSTLTLPYLALTRSNDDVKISSRVSARIKFMLNSGQVVKKGDTLVGLEDIELKNQLKSLNLNINSLKSQLKSKYIALKNLMKTHERTIKLLSVKGASKEQVDKEVTNIEAIKAGIDTLKYKIQEIRANKASINNMLSYTTIKSPVNGIVTRLANVGDVAMLGKPLVAISAKSNSYLIVRLPADVHAKAVIYKGKKYPLSALNTTNNGLLEYLANINESLASNQTVNVDVVIFDANGYKLSADAILNRDGKSYVLDVVGSKAVPKAVKIVANGEQGVIVNGVSPKDRIVVAKQDILLKLLTGIKIKTEN
ncbi:MAG: biotin/lipoyl-binding protein [Campylobacteraceae bacterium]|nr:biotin/lipoyl-binding protein [Campylobacteraceae bacterium]